MFKAPQYPGQNDYPGPLDIVVKGQNLVLVLIQNLGGRPTAEVFKVQQALREEAFDVADKLVNEVKVALAFNPGVALTQVVLVVQ